MELKNKSIKSLILSSTLIVFILLVGSVFVVSITFYSQSMTDSSSTLIKETSNQITYNYENYINSIITTANKIEEKTLSSKDIKSEDINHYILNLEDLQKELLEVSIYDYDGNYLNGDKIKTENVQEDSWFKNALSDTTTHFFAPVSEENNSYQITFSKAISINKLNQKSILKLTIDFKSMIELNYKTNLGDGGHITIVDEDYNVIYSSKQGDLKDEIKILKDLIIGIQNYSQDGNNYTLNIDTLTNTSWRVAIVYNVNYVHAATTNFLLIISIISIIIITLGIILILSMTKFIVTPIYQLEYSINTFKSESPFKKAKISYGSKEIVSLANSYNEMILQIESLMSEVIEQKNNQRKSELKALQNQINPHFLYNTLDSIVWLIENDRKDDASKMVIALAKLFRISISRGNNIIPVKNEIEHVRNYLVIQSMRYKESFKYYINIDEECYKYKVMKLILQPLVENCIYHGLKNRIDEGIIKIIGHMENKQLILTIEDNGYGMRQENINALYERFNNPDLNDGVGLKNVYQRLRLYYGENAYLKIVSEIDEGCSIIISIPVEEIGNEKI